MRSITSGVLYPKKYPMPSAWQAWKRMQLYQWMMSYSVQLHHAVSKDRPSITQGCSVCSPYEMSGDECAGTYIKTKQIHVKSRSIKSATLYVRFNYAFDTPLICFIFPADSGLFGCFEENT
jgi:hypothetical protein